MLFCSVLLRIAFIHDFFNIFQWEIIVFFNFSVSLNCTNKRYLLYRNDVRGLIRLTSSDSGWDFTMRTNVSNTSIPGMSSNSSMHGFHGNPSHGSFSLHGSQHRGSFGLSNPGNLTPSPSNYGFPCNEDFLRRKNSYVSSSGNEYRVGGGELRQSSIRSLDNSLNGVSNKKIGVSTIYSGDNLSGYKKKSRSTLNSREASRENVSSSLHLIRFEFICMHACMYVCMHACLSCY